MNLRIVIDRFIVGQDSHLAEETTARQQHSKRFDQNYGAMRMIMGYLPQIEQLRLQCLDQWWYDTGVARVQVHFRPTKMYLFVGRKSLVAVDQFGECQQCDFKGEGSFLNFCWASCQVGPSRLFQVTDDYPNYRILKVDASQRSFTIERKGYEDWLTHEDTVLVNFRDQFVFHIRHEKTRRYSLANHIQEDVSDLRDYGCHSRM